MSIKVRWRCGHIDPVKDGQKPVSCTVCGDSRRMSVIAPRPRFVGTVKPGPCATFQALDAISMPLVGGQ